MSDKNEKILIGASWYPEMWAESEWPKDAARMKELGFTIVRIFEFAWHKFEPKPNQFDFDWAKRVLDVCHANGIQVMIGTPTAAPPAWLSYGYPDCLRTDINGRRETHGQRRHGSPFSRRYREFSARIVEKMVEAFSDHPAVHSWQVDNELGGSDYGDEAHEDFQNWLKAKFGTIENLNAAWGLEFWSQAYQSFGQVPMPEASVGGPEIQERHHPSLTMSVARHRSETWAKYVAMQCEIIRRHPKNKTRPITTNMTSGYGLDWYKINGSLDRVGFSMYSDLQHYHFNLSNFDRMRAEKSDGQANYTPYYLLETAPSWSAGGRMWNIHNNAQGITMFSWLSTLLGGSMILYWQWRSHWAGQEMQHGTLVTATGEWSVNKGAMQKLTAEHAVHGQWLMEHPPLRADVAVVLSIENAWAFSIDPIDDGMKYQNIFRDHYYMPLVRSHVWRDVISEGHDFGAYKVVVMPLLPMLKADTRAKLKTFVEQGGVAVLGPIIGYRDEEFTAYKDRAFGGLEEIIGADSALRFTTMWVNDEVHLDFVADGALPGVGALQDVPPKYRNWSEAYTPRAGTQVLARYSGGYGDGLPAILWRPVGKGGVLTIGTAVSESQYAALVHAAMAVAGVEPIASGSPDVVVVPRATRDGKVAGYGVANLSKAAAEITVDGESLLVGPLEARLHKV